ncbi:DUF4350 domain-containing protein [Microbacterium sp. cx-55]|uniref:DUF4350 domain-containing protein n=1 Tax=Microbacterium sp. cx-55 TaxID=2875948 RepID=UPI001CC0B950|nr:DUF4350 domain-containing protein [Microbacterium sp. cx-55]UGB36028.1 DUF4350 domain-containing protein [Microbacterium sp. cx-55]
MTSAPARAATALPERSGRRRRVGGWIVIALVLVLVGSLGAVISGGIQWSERGAFDPESAGPGGTRAVARLLAENGIDVQIVRDRAAAEDALRAGSATLVLPDSPLLSDDAFTHLASAATDVVVAEPRARSIRVLFEGRLDGFGETTPVAPGCGLAEAERAGPVVIGVTFASDTATGCYPVGEGYGLLTVPRGDGRAVAIDGTALFTNATLASDGNAALALNLLGARDRVVWFVPSLADSDGAAGTLGELTPGWVSPAIVLLLAAALAAIIWRGRRFGPLVRERLPVTVRGSETTRGRARLYARSRDVPHAADAIRQATVARLARLTGLAASSSAVSVSDAVAARLDRDPREVRALLVDDVPRTDRDLVALIHHLHDLEAALSAALRPGKDPR